MADSWGSTSGGEILSSPVPENAGNSWQTSVPTTAPIGGDWMNILKFLASSGGKGVGAPNVPFGNIGSQLVPQQGVPMYYMPQAAQPIQDEQQKQTSAGDVGQYASMLAKLFL